MLRTILHQCERRVGSADNRVENTLAQVPVLESQLQHVLEEKEDLWRLVDGLCAKESQLIRARDDQAAQVRRAREDGAQRDAAQLADQRRREATAQDAARMIEQVLALKEEHSKLVAQVKEQRLRADVLERERNSLRDQLRAVHQKLSLAESCRKEDARTLVSREAELKSQHENELQRRVALTEQDRAAEVEREVLKRIDLLKTQRKAKLLEQQQQQEAREAEKRREQYEAQRAAVQEEKRRFVESQGVAAFTSQDTSSPVGLVDSNVSTPSGEPQTPNLRTATPLSIHTGGQSVHRSPTNDALFLPTPSTSPDGTAQAVKTEA